MEQQKPALASGHCIIAKSSCSWSLSTASCLVIDLLRDRTRCSPFLTCDTDGTHVKLLKKKGLFSTVWKKPQIPCTCPFSPSRLSKNVCVGITGLWLSVFCRSALLLFSFWQAGTISFPFWSGPTFFFSCFLVCSLGTDCPSHAQNVTFHEYLPC